MKTIITSLCLLLAVTARAGQLVYAPHTSGYDGSQLTNLNAIKFTITTNSVGTNWTTQANGSNVNARFISTNLVINASTNVAHGLGRTPDEIDAYFVCVTSNNTFNAGERVKLPAFDVVNAEWLYNVWANSTNIGINYLAAFSSTPQGVDKNGGGFTYSASNWKLILEARTSSQ